MKTPKILALLATTALGIGVGVACDVEDEAVSERGADQCCTLTQGYWKTHSSEAKQPKKRVDWPSGFGLDENAPFIAACGEHGTYLEVLHTPPRGSAYYILAHQYIAAKLNVLDCHGHKDAEDADAWPLILEAYQILLSDCAVTSDEFARAIELSEDLDAYNNGDWGPGHCG